MKSESLQEHTKEDTSVVETEEIDSLDVENNSTSRQNVNIQNNLHFVQNIDIANLNVLSQTNPNLADRAMSLYENQFNHAKSMDEKIIKLEANEQDSRDKDRPWQRFFAFLSISTSVGVSIFSLMKAYEFYINGASDTVVGLCISIPVGIVAVNLLGIKNKGQK